MIAATSVRRVTPHITKGLRTPTIRMRLEATKQWIGSTDGARQRFSDRKGNDMQLTEEQRKAIEWAADRFARDALHENDLQDRHDFNESATTLRSLLAAPSAGAQGEPVGTAVNDEELGRFWEIHKPASEFPVGTHVYTHPQPMTQTDAARDAEDAKRYRFIKSQMKVGAVQTQLPLYRTLHWIGDEDCSDVHNEDAAIDAEIERLDRAKGE